MSGHERISVLVADHDRWTRLNLSTMLDDAGFCVEQASNGVAAVRIAEIAQPQIVLLRHNLPEIGAADLLHMLRGDRRTRHCAVLQVRDGNFAEDELDSDGLLNLPCHPIDLLAMVIDALEARRAPRVTVDLNQVEVAGPVRSVSASTTSSMRTAGRSGKWPLSSRLRDNPMNDGELAAWTAGIAHDGSPDT